MIFNVKFNEICISSNNNDNIIYQSILMIIILSRYKHCFDLSIVGTKGKLILKW